MAITIYEPYIHILLILCKSFFILNDDVLNLYTESRSKTSTVTLKWMFFQIIEYFVHYIFCLQCIFTSNFVLDANLVPYIILFNLSLEFGVGYVSQLQPGFFRLVEYQQAITDSHYCDQHLVSESQTLSFFSSVLWISLGINYYCTCCLT